MIAKIKVISLKVDANYVSYALTKTVSQILSPIVKQSIAIDKFSEVLSDNLLPISFYNDNLLTIIYRSPIWIKRSPIKEYNVTHGAGGLKKKQTIKITKIFEYLSGKFNSGNSNMKLNFCWVILVYSDNLPATNFLNKYL